MTDDRINRTIKLFLADGLPPSINVVQLEVHEDWEGKLIPDELLWRKRRSFGIEDGPSVSVQREDVNLEEVIVEGRRFLAGFGQISQVLVLGWLKEER